MRSVLVSLALCLAGTAWAQDAEEAAAEEPAAEEAASEEATEEEATETDGSKEAEPAGEDASEEAAAEEPAAAEPEAKTEAEEPAADDGIEARMAALEAEIERLKGALDTQGKEIAEQKLASIPKDKFKFDVEGHYRTRGYVFPDLFPNPGGNRSDARYMDHRLRIRPVFNYNDLAKLMFEVDALDGVVWGDNSSLASTSLFAGAPSNTLIDGTTAPSVSLTRAWMEFSVPVGLLRVGRQPSDWGMGLLANNGDGFDDTFGENKGGATYDHAIFATKPIAIAQTIMGKNASDIPLFLAIGVDRLVEDPLIQFHGHQCEEGIDRSTDPDDYDPRCDDDGDGITDLDHGFTDDTRTEDRRGQDWWQPQRDDVMQMIYVLIYRGEDVELFGTKGDLTAGTYVVNRFQGETASDLWIFDGYVNAKFHGVLFETEWINIRGRTRAIALPGAFDPTVEDLDPLEKKANIWGYVVKAGYEKPDWKLMFEHGYASGDDNVIDQNFTGRPLHSDYNVGLILYEEIIARVTSEGWTESAEGLWSNGGVYNSRYIFPKAHWYPLDNWEILGGFLMAWPDKPDGSFIRCNDPSEGCIQSVATAGPIGWEIDAGLHHTWHKHLRLALEFGYAHATDRLPLESAGLAVNENGAGNYTTFQTRIGWEF